MARRAPPPVPGVVTGPLASLWRYVVDAFSGDPLAHAATHLKTGSDPLTGGVESSVAIDGSNTEGSGPQVSHKGHTHKVTTPLTTKGDSLTHTGAVHVREAVGEDGRLLQADSAEATGRKWSRVATIIGALLTTKGDILTRDASLVVRKGVGQNGLALVADSAQADGLRYGPKAVRATPGATENNYAPGAATIYFLTASVACSMTGLVAGTVDGEERTVWNVGANAITLSHQNAGSSAANRFQCQGGADVVLNQHFKAVLNYDLTAAYWRVVAA